MGISEVVHRRSVDSSSPGPPLPHVRTARGQRAPRRRGLPVRSVNFLVLDDALRPQVARAGIPSVLAKALKSWRGDTVCLREFLG